ncbi:MAG: CHAT domain-containing protein, partial [Bacteroidales bacterium]|nr:CHAT domain-containing protein [Bacteroidales bacterium]
FAYSGLGDNEKAKESYSAAAEICLKMFGEKHPQYATSLNNLSLAYMDGGDKEKALDFCRKALGIREDVFGKNHPSYSASLYNMAGIYNHFGDYAEALGFYKQASKLQKSNIVRNFSFMTAHERETFWNANSEYCRKQLNVAYRLPSDTAASRLSYDTELITKGLLLTSEIEFNRLIAESGDSALVSEFDNMRKLSLMLNIELEKPVLERIVNCDSLNDEIQKEERHLVEKCKPYGDFTRSVAIGWKDVRNALKGNDVAIEFTSYIICPDSTMYAAIVLAKNMESPVFVPLFEQKEMNRLLRGVAPKEVTHDENERGATSVSAKRLGIYESTGLYDLLWKPLEKYFPENPRIYFAPSGMLHKIAVEYAPIDHSKTISDKYEIYRVSSTRFLAMDYMPSTLKKSVLYGGIFYDSDTVTMKRESERYSTRSTSISSFAAFNKGEERGSLSYLSGTKTEVEDIFGKLNKRKIKATLYEGSQANEESFKALSGDNIDVLHIATHGFFLPSEEKLSGENSLIQSGLLLSGANYAWQNQPLPEGIEDGILTAKEIAFMDLRKTDLVVLSACQTALGEITSEGVFGLQRGFKKAGARTVIMSLWPVDDNATLLMMTEFYTNLTSGMNKREAFIAAQNKVKNSAGFENPRYWAAFIMLDGNER